MPIPFTDYVLTAHHLKALLEPMPFVLLSLAIGYVLNRYLRYRLLLAQRRHDSDMMAVFTSATKDLPLIISFCMGLSLIIHALSLHPRIEAAFSNIIYSVIVLTGQDTISPTTLEILTKFVQCGGTVIATSILPKHASVKGEDARVITLVENLFGVSEMPRQVTKKRHGTGYAWAIPFGELSELRAILAEHSFDLELDTPTAGIGYLHKSFPHGEAYYLVNRNAKEAHVRLTLRETRGGDLTVRNPFTGETSKLESTEEKGGQTVTLSIPGNRSCFLISGDVSEE